MRVGIAGRVAPFGAAGADRRMGARIGPATAKRRLARSKAQTNPVDLTGFVAVAALLLALVWLGVVAFAIALVWPYIVGSSAATRIGAAGARGAVGGAFEAIWLAVIVYLIARFGGAMLREAWRDVVDDVKDGREAAFGKHTAREATPREAEAIAKAEELEEERLARKLLDAIGVTRSFLHERGAGRQAWTVGGLDDIGVYSVGVDGAISAAVKGERASVSIHIAGLTVVSSDHRSLRWPLQDIERWHRANDGTVLVIERRSDPFEPIALGGVEEFAAYLETCLRVATKSIPNRDALLELSAMALPLEIELAAG